MNLILSTLYFIENSRPAARLLYKGRTAANGFSCQYDDGGPIMDGQVDGRLKSVSICRGLLDLGRHIRWRRHGYIHTAAILLFTGQELELLQNDLRSRLRRVIPVEPGVEREPTLHVEPMALTNVTGDRLGLLAERGHSKPVGPLDPSVRRILESVRCDRKICDEGSVVRYLSLRFLAEVADKRNVS